jgi:2-C-methyl-D-erythritol 4-phosphate cytidylyltransferase
MTPVPFVAVLRAAPAEAAEIRPILVTAGASAVLAWSDPELARLSAGPAPDETPVVLVDCAADEIDLDRLADDVSAALTALADHADTVIATVRPVTDTLKLVDAEGVVTGTAERDRHRFVGSPIAMPLRRLRALSASETDAGRAGPARAEPPSAVAFLTTLIAGGATVRTAVPVG